MDPFAVKVPLVHQNVCMTEGEARLSWWERQLEWPLTGLAMIFLVLYAFEVLDTGLNRGQRDAVDLGLTAIWAVFGLDYLVRLGLAGDRRRFLRTHLVDLMVLLLPMARPLRALRVIAMISTLNRRMRGGFRAKVGIYVAATTLLVATVASLAVLEAERYAPHATITTFGDAAWWTLSTISTVGYGDLYPVTTEGRVVASTLMVAGIALLGVITGSFATWFVDNLREVEDEVGQSSDRVAAKLDELLEEVRLLGTRIQLMEADHREHR
jgi:voltage-gated potassium channel